ncbi:hypothetical protein J6590_080641 [Homalodisca vitripennis]|nr:hypothetical protein J6590_080641 [Homalodisca vitripennis]
MKQRLKKGVLDMWVLVNNADTKLNSFSTVYAHNDQLSVRGTWVSRSYQKLCPDPAKSLTHLSVSKSKFLSKGHILSKPVFKERIFKGAKLKNCFLPTTWLSHTAAGLGLVRGLESGLSKVRSHVKVAGDWGTSGCYMAAVNTDSNRAAKLEMPFMFMGSSVSDKACPTT